MADWNLASLTELFAADPPALGDVDVSIEGDVLRVTIKEKGNLDVFVVAGGDHILVSVLLVAAAAVSRREAFDRLCLRTHKLVPLSTFGLTVVNGEEWYELFGSLSARSAAEVVIEEVAVLVANAHDAAVLIQDWQNGEIAA
ncbi:DUF2170 family protein [Aureimonas jatrophae]|uniref:Sensory transduction regulator n=1 Tax=Aureimonas jatrophae TaxID=1166073 RepID=A0A1H0LM60_9HYPH|nr:DUF2170 family protein [Aureimonas jatrophae]MBB3952587.1 hypothetical protein [Aureimonas jatrophae]SDO69302.1 hypothetical protein SAMN05192530_110102 [Aureimonas jatrophae]